MDKDEVVKELAAVARLFVTSRDNGDNNDDEIDAMARAALKKFDHLWS